MVSIEVTVLLAFCVDKCGQHVVVVFLKFEIIIMYESISEECSYFVGLFRSYTSIILAFLKESGSLA